MAILRFPAMVSMVFSVISCLASAQAGAASVPALVGATGAYTETPGHPALPSLTFIRADGGTATLADFKGKLVLLNLWATWCAPCVKEMPTLDRLQADLGGDRFQVVTLSEDRAGARVVTPFLAAHNLPHLAAWVDDKSATMTSLRLGGLPTTLLIDSDGHELGRLEGDADWSSDAARALVRHYLERGLGQGK